MILNLFWLCRFKIHLLVKDDTGESSFMLLDSIATGIVPQSAEYLLDGSLDEVGNFLICVSVANAVKDD